MAGKFKTCLKRPTNNNAKFVAINFFSAAPAVLEFSFDADVCRSFISAGDEREKRERESSSMS
jgi:hypothetical protein